MEIQTRQMTSSETKIMESALSYNSNNYTCSFYNINEEKIKIVVITKDYLLKYQNEYNFTDLRKINKYFKMFDNIKELEADLIGLNNLQKIEISNVSETMISLCINVLTIDNNKIIFQLSKIELNEKEKIDKKIKENEEIKKENEEMKKQFEEIKKKFEEIKKENEEIKKDLKLKESKILLLEKEIQEIKKEFLKPRNHQEDYNLLYFNSNIFLNQNEKNLVLKQISNSIKSVKILFDSKIYGANVDKLKEAYLNRPHLLFVIKTKKGKRFGAYSCEIFKDELFHKKDINAFLFSLDNMKICKSRNTEHDIWKQTMDSIDFGPGTDLRIFYDFSSNNNYTNESGYDYSNCQSYILNGERNFSVELLEIYQIIF